MAENVQQKQITPLILQKPTYKIVIPPKVEDMIRLLCSEVKQVEWSGALFYTYTGSFETNDLVITCQDICVMDIGSGGYTEFVESPIIINYQMEKDLLDCKVGLIHSHNNMPTFFSGTDTNTLRSEGSAMNNFVSLIVNNAGNYSAAITRLVKAIQDVRASKSYEFFGDGTIEMGSSQYYETAMEVEYFKLDIEKHTGSNNEIISRLEEIRHTKGKLISATPLSKYGNDFDKDTETFRQFMQEQQKEKEATIKIKSDKKEPTYKEPTLFDDMEFEPDINYDTELSQDIVDTATLQIITGSIVVTCKNNVSIQGWMEKIDSVYDNRFPNPKDFEYWVDSHIDAVLNTTNLEELDELETDVAQAILAYKINLILEEYMQNSEYVSMMHNIIDRYILL